MTICAVETLDPENYSQRVLTRLAPPPGTGARAAHTINRCADIEVMDFLAPLPRKAFHWLFAPQGVPSLGQVSGQSG
jgi:hypothetical protein